MQARKQVLCSQSETGSLHTPSLFQPLFTAQSDDRFVRETRATVLQFLSCYKPMYTEIYSPFAEQKKNNFKAEAPPAIHRATL